MANLKGTLSMEREKFSKLEFQMNQLSNELAHISLAKEESDRQAEHWKEMYLASQAEAANAVPNWRKTPEYQQELEEYMSAHGDVLFVGGWNECRALVLDSYPEVDPIAIMEPAERARHLRRLEKAKAHGVEEKDLDPTDDAIEFTPVQPDDDDDGSDDGDAPLTVDDIPGPSGAGLDDE